MMRLDLVCLHRLMLGQVHLPHLVQILRLLVHHLAHPLARPQVLLLDHPRPLVRPLVPLLARPAIGRMHDQIFEIEFGIYKSQLITFRSTLQ